MIYADNIDELCELVISDSRHIASSLGRLWRFGGQHPTANVLYHSLEVAWMCRHLSPAARLWALHHDVHELLTGEIPKSHKTTELMNLQSHYDMRLKNALGITLSSGELKQIEEADSLCGATEFRQWENTIWLWMGESDLMPVDEFVYRSEDLRLMVQP